MFAYLLVVVLGGAAVHFALGGERSVSRAGEIGLLWLLVGYCGVPMLAVSLWSLLSPERVADVLGFPAGNPFQDFVSAAFLGMSLLSLLALRYRGVYLVGPAVCWAVFFAGATFAHLKDLASHGGVSHHHALFIFATHGLISVLLVAALLASGLWKARG